MFQWIQLSQSKNIFNSCNQPRNTAMYQTTGSCFQISNFFIRIVVPCSNIIRIFVYNNSFAPVFGNFIIISNTLSHINSNSECSYHSNWNQNCWSHFFCILMASCIPKLYMFVQYKKSYIHISQILIKNINKMIIIIKKKRKKRIKKSCLQGFIDQKEDNKIKREEKQIEKRRRRLVQRMIKFTTSKLRQCLRASFVVQVNNYYNFSQSSDLPIQGKITKKSSKQTQTVQRNTSQPNPIQSNITFDTSNRMGGSSQDGLYQLYANGKFKNTAIQRFKSIYKKFNKQKDPLKKYDSKYIIPGATIITNRDQCLYCVEKLYKTKTIIAWDTETIDLDIKNQTPVGKGRIIAASFFAGPQYNFGNGPRVFIDNFGANAGLIDYFKQYLEDQKYKKVWHNYGFDRHLFYNHGINVRGFGGDTMHMARLQDSSLLPGGYSLASLTQKHAGNIQKIKKRFIERAQLSIIKLLAQQQTPERTQELQQLKKNLDQYRLYYQNMSLKKIKMQQKFKRKKVLKSGQIGKTYQYPSLLTLHTTQQYIKDWIQYSVLDAESTFYLRQVLQCYLREQKSSQYPGLDNTLEIYNKYWLPFGEVLTDMERVGFKIDLEHVYKIEKQAAEKMEQKKKKFVEWVVSIQKGSKNIELFNPSSGLQLQQLIFAPYKIQQQMKILQKIKKDKQQQALQNGQQHTDQQQQLLVNAQQQKKYQPAGKRKPVDLSQVQKTLIVQNDDPDKGRKKVQMVIKGLGIPAQKFTPQGLPSVDQAILHILAGNPKQGKYGKAYDFFKLKDQQQFGKSFCQALDILLEHRSLETLLSTFILPLKQYPDKNHRIHCSLNINTQTGRLSARKPNMQNQPALEKDIFKIRKAFVAEKGNKLIVADYGQLELRVLAHLTNCKTMIKAFEQGGDFHSRTAISMYPYIKQQIQQGKLLLQWDKSKGQAPAPLLKVKYASQRKKAKTVNFSIAYGKSAKGFADDWNCTLQQAKQVIKAWFADRPQVQQWQKNKQKIAQKKKITQTLLGRYRKLDKFFDEKLGKSQIGMRQRRAINTPIQGGAADIVIASMVKIHFNQELKKLGWKLLMQIHDQLILQGPQQSAQQALQIVRYNMCHPFEKDLLVELQIDAKIGDNWYECK